jgi:hypothetical protein
MLVFYFLFINSLKVSHAMFVGICAKNRFAKVITRLVLKFKNPSLSIVGASVKTSRFIRALFVYLVY